MVRSVVWKKRKSEREEKYIGLGCVCEARASSVGGDIKAGAVRASSGCDYRIEKE